MSSYSSYDKSVWETIWEFFPGVIKFLSGVGLIFCLFTLTVNLTGSSSDTGGEISIQESIRPFNGKVGPRDSKVKVVYLSDYQCPACRSNNPNMNVLKKDYGDRVEFIYKHFPLIGTHANAVNAARAVQAAGRQDKFFEYGDIVYQNQDQGLSVDNLSKFADQAGLDRNKWNQDRNSSEIWNEVDTDLNDLTNLSLPKSSITGRSKKAGNLNDMGTPTVIIVKDGQIYDWWSSVLPIDQFKSKLDEALK